MEKVILGSHYLAEFYGCSADTINSKDQLREAMIRAAQIAKATIVADVFHEFNPYGLSGVVVIAESHLAIHTWPEYRCASVDIFTCSKDMQPEAAIEFLKTYFKAEASEVRLISRGEVSLRAGLPASP